MSIILTLIIRIIIKTVPTPFKKVKINNIDKNGKKEGLFEQWEVKILRCSDKRKKPRLKCSVRITNRFQVTR